MAKSNDKKNRTDGTTESNNEKYSTPLTSKNTPLSDYSFTDAEKIKRESKQNKLF